SGATWTTVAALPARASKLAAHPSNGVYAVLGQTTAISLGLGLYRFFADGSSSLLSFANQNIAALHVGPNGVVLVSATGCAGCDDWALYRSTDDGASWVFANAASVSNVASGGGLVFAGAIGYRFGEVCQVYSVGALFSSDGFTWEVKN